MAAELAVTPTAIPGLLVLELPLHGDSRGWFKENWQREKMVALGLPDFRPVQNNMSYNATLGTARGLHAEPWDKLVSVAHGRVFGAWVDLREGDSHGTTFSIELDESRAVFVPRGVANGYQTLTDDVTYSYLVNAHWSAGAIDSYAYVNLADENAGIDWPIPLADCQISEKDRHHPHLGEAKRVRPAQTLILGAHGQLGRALMAQLPGARAVGREELDVTDTEALQQWPWRDYDTVINAAAWTNVDAAETPEGRVGAWRANACSVAELARIANRYNLRLVHISSDYVFDGTQAVVTEDQALAPLGVYGQSKAAGDLAVQVVDRHYLLRTSWVVGDGRNFISIMEELAERGVSPSVVDDQIGRLTHTSTLAAAIVHLLETSAPYGTYNCTDGGDAASWADIAKAVFGRSGRSSDDVTPVDTATYFKDKQAAPRPANSVLDLSKLEATGFDPPVFGVGEL